MTREELSTYDLPDAPGVYMFLDIKKKIVYIGKATSLRDRVRSYFAPDLHDVRSPMIAQMVADAVDIKWIEVGSVLEAMVLEASLIKKHQPIANTKEKDNRSHNYVVITDEEFPRVVTVRGRILFDTAVEKKYVIKEMFGPFPHGSQLREALAIVRKIFPFRDTCAPFVTVTQDRIPSESHKKPKPCFNHQIGLCPGVCVGAISAKQYAQTIRNIRELFSGKFTSLKDRLHCEMIRASNHQHFESARILQRQIASLSHIRDVALIKGEYDSTGGTHSIRIEAYDVAHTGGSETVGVMVVSESGEMLKAEYRSFNIKTATNDDSASLTELLSRRLRHAEWALPGLIVLDGGMAQMHAAQQVLKLNNMNIPLVGVVKDTRHKPDHLIGDADMIKQYEKDILALNAEAHRYAITKHRARLRKALINIVH